MSSQKAKGGLARAAKLTPDERKAIASTAAKARWSADRPEAPRSKRPKLRTLELVIHEKDWPVVEMYELIARSQRHTISSLFMEHARKAAKEFASQINELNIQVNS